MVMLANNNLVLAIYILFMHSINDNNKHQAVVVSSATTCYFVLQVSERVVVLGGAKIHHVR